MEPKEPILYGEEQGDTEEFRQKFRQEFSDLLESGLFETEPLPPDPSSMGLGETTLEELSPEQLSIVRETIFGKLGVDDKNPDFLHREYESEAPEEATVPGK